MFFLSFRSIVTIKVQLLLLATLLVLGLQLFTDSSQSHWVLAKAVASVLLSYALMLNMNAMTNKSKNSPISLVKGVVLLSIVLILHYSISNSLLEMFGIPSTEKYSGKLHISFFSNASGFLYSFISLSLFTYILLSLKELFFNKQRKKSKTYYFALMAYLAVTSVTYVFAIEEFGTSLEFIHIAFYVLTIILIVINSLRISWIAFLSKQEKKLVLLLSAILIATLTANLVLLSGSSAARTANDLFSPALNVFIQLMSIYGIIYFSVLSFTTLFHLPTAEVFDKKNRDLSLFQYFSRLMNRVLDFGELAENIVETALEITNSKAAWLEVNENANHTILSPNLINYTDAVKLTDYILNRATSHNPGADKVHTVPLSEYYKTGETEVKYKYAFVAPLQSVLSISGNLIIVTTDDALLEDDDKKTLHTFLEYASAALQNSRLVKESIEKERLEKELDLARDLQKKLLPAQMPDSPQTEFTAVFIPAFEVGGDYYDYFTLSQNSLGFTVADVSGKGVSAAFIMAELRGILNSIFLQGESPKAILVKANSILKKTLDSKSFITAILGVINEETGKVTLVRAGHTPALLVQGNEVKEITPTGLGLGLNFTKLFEQTLQQIELTMNKNDMLVLFTDGVTESQNEKDVEFGLDELKRIIIKNKELPINEISSEIIREISRYSVGKPQHDDITLVILRRKV